MYRRLPAEQPSATSSETVSNTNTSNPVPSETISQQPSTTPQLTQSPSTKNIQDEKTDTIEERSIFSESDPLNGFFNKLRAKCGGNPHTKGQVVITASSSLANNPWQVIDYGWTSHWVTKNEPDQWIKFDFLTGKFHIYSYTLKTYNYVAGGNHLRSWVIEGSSNGNDWLELDRRHGLNDLNDRYKVKNFSCKNPGAFRYIRLKQIGKSHCDSYNLALTNIEFFGILKE